MSQKVQNKRIVSTTYFEENKLCSVRRWRYRLKQETKPVVCSFKEDEKKHKNVSTYRRKMAKILHELL